MPGTHPPHPPSARPAGGFRRLFRTSLFLIPIGVIGNVALSLLTTERALLREVAGFPRHYLLLAVGLALFPWVTSTLRLLLWTRFLGYPLNGREALRITLANDVGVAVSPTLVGGAFFKWGMLVERGVSPGAAASLSALPTLEDGVFFLLFIPLGLVVSHSWELPIFRSLTARVPGGAVSALGVSLAIALLSWLAVRLVLSGRLGSRARQHGLQLYARLRRRLRTTGREARQVFALIAERGKARFALSLSLTALGWLARYSVISAIVAFLGFEVHWLLFTVLQWVVFTLMSLIPTPGGAGGAEAAFFLIYRAFIPTQALGLVTASWRFLTFYLQIALAALLFALLGLAERRRLVNAPPR